MGFFSLFKKKEPPVSVAEEISVPLEELQSFYNQKLGSKLHDAEKKAQLLREGIASSFASLSFKHLESAVFEKGDKRYAAVNMSKDSYVTKAKKLIQSIPSTGKGYQNSLDFQKHVTGILDEIKNTTPKQAMALSHYFKDESAGIISGLKKSEDSLKSFSEFLGSDGKVMEFFSKLGNEGREITQLLENEKSLEKKEQSLEKDLLENEKSLEKNKEQLEQLLKGAEWKQMESLEARIEKMKNEISELKASIKEALAPLKRPLKKARHIEGGKAFADFISSPFNTFLAGGEEKLKLTIETVLSLAASGKLVLKGSEQQKLKRMEAQIGDLVSEKQSYISLLKELKSAKKELEALPLLGQRNQLEKSRDQLTVASQNLKNETTSLSEARKSMEKEVTLKREALEKRILKSTGDRITIR